MVKTHTGTKPRILLDLIAFGRADGGFTTSVTTLLDALSYLPEFDFGILCRHSDRDFFERSGARVHSARVNQRLKFLASLWITPSVFRQYAYDAVHADISLVAARLAHVASLRVHDLYFLRDRSVGPRRWLARLSSNLFERYYIRSIRSTKVIGCISECTRRDLAALVGRSDGVLPLPHVVRLPSVAPCRRPWPSGQEAIQILFVGSLVPRKNLRLLLRAVQTLSRPWTLDIVGNVWWGAEEVQKFLGDSRIRLHGFVSDERLAEFYRQSHVTVLPSLYEGFGLPAAEAVAAGSLALVAEGSGFDEYVPSTCRFSPRDASTLRDLLEGLSEPQAAHGWSTTYAALKRYSAAAHVEAYRAAFGQLLAGPRGVVAGLNRNLRDDV